MEVGSGIRVLHVEVGITKIENVISQHGKLRETEITIMQFCWVR